MGRCRLTVSNPSRKRAWFQGLKLQCDEPLSNFAFNFSLRRYRGVTVETAVERRQRQWEAERRGGDEHQRRWDQHEHRAQQVEPGIYCPPRH